MQKGWILSLVIAYIELDLDVVWVSETDVLLFAVWIELNPCSANAEALQAAEEGLEGTSVWHAKGEMIKSHTILVEPIVRKWLEGWALET